MDLDVILEAGSIKSLLARLVRNRIGSALYERPEKYFEYVEKIFTFNIPDNLKATYVEIKATRDLLVHSSGLINEVYLRKVGSAGRGASGSIIPLSETYLIQSMATMKALVRHLYTGCLDAYGNSKAVRTLPE